MIVIKVIYESERCALKPKLKSY